MKSFRVIALGLVAIPSLSSCWFFIPPPPPYVPPIPFSIAIPNTADAAGIEVGLFSIDTDGKQTMLSSVYGNNYYPSYPLSKDSSAVVSQTSPVLPPSGNSDPAWIYSYLSVYSSELSNVEANPKLVTPFTRDQTADQDTPLIISNANVKTADLYFIAWRDANGDRKMNNAERIYFTGDVLSYSTDDFTYSYTGKTAAGAYTESGSRKKGWSLVPRRVYSPTANTFKITMNSGDSKNYTIKLHEEVNLFSSMGISSMGLLSTGLLSTGLGGTK